MPQFPRYLPTDFQGTRNVLLDMIDHLNRKIGFGNPTLGTDNIQGVWLDKSVTNGTNTFTHNMNVTVGAANTPNVGWLVFGQKDASASAFAGALVKLDSNDTGISASTPYRVPWDSAVYQSGGTFWVGGSPTRLSVPTGVTKVRLHGSVRTNNTTAASTLFARFLKNGSADFIGAGSFAQVAHFTGTSHNSISSAVLPVTGGSDYFELDVQHASTFDLQADRSHFAIEVVEWSDGGTGEGVLKYVPGGTVTTNAIDLVWTGGTTNLLVFMVRTGDW